MLTSHLKITPAVLLTRKQFLTYKSPKFDIQLITNRLIYITNFNNNIKFDVDTLTSHDKTN